MTISPNPFRDKTVITFGRMRSGNRILEVDRNLTLALKIYDATGRLVKDCNALLSHPMSSNQITWDGLDDKGNTLPQGVYFVHLTTSDNSTIIRKLVKLK